MVLLIWFETKVAYRTDISISFSKWSGIAVALAVYISRIHQADSDPCVAVTSLRLRAICCI
jgi:hypothetical protein